MCDSTTGTSNIHLKKNVAIAKCNFIHVLDPQHISNKTAITITIRGIITIHIGHFIR